MLRQGETGDWIGTFEGHKGAVWGVALNSQATLAATAAADFQAIVWDALSGSVKHSLAHKHIVKTVDFSSDDSLLVTGSNEKLLRIFDLNRPDSGKCHAEHVSVLADQIQYKLISFLINLDDEFRTESDARAWWRNQASAFYAGRSSSAEHCR